TPWAGGNYGFQFVPRVGMEVLVTFLGGDPDRPGISGCLPGAATPVPHLLPRDKTRSGIRSRTSPEDEGGYNELAFEDAAGREQVVIHAHRDLEEEVGNDHTTRVHHSQTLTVDGDQTTMVGGSQMSSVRFDRVSSVGRDSADSVRGDASLDVAGNRSV